MNTAIRMILLSGVLFVGCSRAPTPTMHATSIDESLSVVSAAELGQYVKASERPVLVEFGVDFNCGRCESIKSSIVSLAEKFEDQAGVIRVDFTSNVELVTKYGGTVCPTYVLFDKGQPVMVQSFPTSGDILEAELLNLLPGTKGE